MGKNLIIKGADFSQNSIGRESSVIQGYMNTAPSTSAYKKIVTPDTSSSAMVTYCIMTKIAVPAGKQLSLFIENNGSIITNLKSDYLASTDNISLVGGNQVTNVSDVVTGGTDSYRQPDGSFLLTNTSNTDLYYYINFSYSTSGPALNASGKCCIYAIQEPQS